MNNQPYLIFIYLFDITLHPNGPCVRHIWMGTTILNDENDIMIEGNDDPTMIQTHDHRSANSGMHQSFFFLTTWPDWHGPAILKNSNCQIMCESIISTIIKK